MQLKRCVPRWFRTGQRKNVQIPAPCSLRNQVIPAARFSSFCFMCEWAQALVSLCATESLVDLVFETNLKRQSALRWRNSPLQTTRISKSYNSDCAFKLGLPKLQWHTSQEDPAWKFKRANVFRPSLKLCYDAAQDPRDLLRVLMQVRIIELRYEHGRGQIELLDTIF